MAPVTFAPAGAMTPSADFLLVEKAFVLTLKMSSASLSGSVGCTSDWGSGGLTPADHDHEMFSVVILSLQLIQDGQLSVSGERMCTILVNRLED